MVSDVSQHWRARRTRKFCWRMLMCCECLAKAGYLGACHGGLVECEVTPKEPSVVVGQTELSFSVGQQYECTCCPPPLPVYSFLLLLPSFLPCCFLFPSHTSQLIFGPGPSNVVKGALVQRCVSWILMEKNRMVPSAGTGKRRSEGREIEWREWEWRDWWWCCCSLTCLCSSGRIFLGIEKERRPKAAVNMRCSCNGFMQQKIQYASQSCCTLHNSMELTKIAPLFTFVKCQIPSCIDQKAVNGKWHEEG